MQGMPKGRNLSGYLFGMSTCRPGLGVYAPSLSSRARLPKPAPTPSDSMSANVLSIHPGGPAIAADPPPGFSEKVLAPHLVDQRMETAGRVLPWLSHVIRSGVAGPFQTLVGSRQWSRLFSFPHRSRTGATFPPPALPGFPGNTSPSTTLPLAGFRLARATPPTGLPVLSPSPSSMRAAVNTPAGPAGARVARFPAGASLLRFLCGSAPTLPVSEACSTFTHVAAHMVAKPP